GDVLGLLHARDVLPVVVDSLNSRILEHLTRASVVLHCSVPLCSGLVNLAGLLEALVADVESQRHHVFGLERVHHEL
ncbi:hypothetical protein PMAYCL1PPCAC_31200, partial [Pristionchus mayeri]